MELLKSAPHNALQSKKQIGSVKGTGGERGISFGPGHPRFNQHCETPRTPHTHAHTTHTRTQHTRTHTCQKRAKLVVNQSHRKLARTAPYTAEWDMRNLHADSCTLGGNWSSEMSSQQGNIKTTRKSSLTPQKRVFIFYLFIYLFFFWGGGTGRLVCRSFQRMSMNFLTGRESVCAAR